jgi:hypothetical protein
MSLCFALLKKGRFHMIPRLMFLTYAAYWEFPDVALYFRQYANVQEQMLSIAIHEGVEYRSIWLIRQAHRRLDFRYHWVDRGRLMDIIKTVEHRRFLEIYERAKITMAKNTYNWSQFPGNQIFYYPSFNPPHPECLPYASSRYVGQWPIYELRSVEGLPYRCVPDRLQFLVDELEHT